MQVRNALWKSRQVSGLLRKRVKILVPILAGKSHTKHAFHILTKLDILLPSFEFELFWCLAAVTAKPLILNCSYSVTVVSELPWMKYGKSIILSVSMTTRHVDRFKAFQVHYNLWKPSKTYLHWQHVFNITPPLSMKYLNILLVFVKQYKYFSKPNLHCFQASASFGEKIIFWMQNGIKREESS